MIQMLTTADWGLAHFEKYSVKVKQEILPFVLLEGCALGNSAAEKPITKNTAIKETKDFQSPRMNEKTQEEMNKFCGTNQQKDRPKDEF